MNGQRPAAVLMTSAYQVLMGLMWLVIARQIGGLWMLFLIGYAIARSIGEVFREPEINLGAYSFLTWGQILSLPMFLFGLYLVMRKPRVVEGAK